MIARDSTVDDCAAIHVDTLNGQAALMRELVEDLSVESLTSGGAAVRSELLSWDGRSDPTSHGAALFSAWRTALVRWFTAQPQLAALHTPTGHSRIFASWLDVDGQVGAGWHSLVRGAPRSASTSPPGCVPHSIALRQRSARTRCGETGTVSTRCTSSTS